MKLFPSEDRQVFLPVDQTDVARKVVSNHRSLTKFIANDGLRALLISKT